MDPFAVFSRGRTCRPGTSPGSICLCPTLQGSMGKSLEDHEELVTSPSNTMNAAAPGGAPPRRINDSKEAILMNPCPAVPRRGPEANEPSQNFLLPVSMVPGRTRSVDVVFCRTKKTSLHPVRRIGPQAVRHVGKDGFDCIFRTVPLHHLLSEAAVRDPAFDDRQVLPLL